MAGQLIRKGDKKWLVRVFVGRDGGGKRRYTSELVHGTKKKADARLAELLHERNTVGLVAKPKETVDQYLDAWLETTVKPSVKARTYHGYEDDLRRYVRPYLGEMKLARLTPVEVRGMLVALREKGLSARTVRKAHETLRNALEQAVADRLIRDNPARSRLVAKALPQKEEKERTTITPDRIADFLEAAEHDRLAAYWALMLFGGLRPEEALALRWRDVTGNLVSVTRVLVDKHGLELHFEDPKTKKSRRAVEVPDVVVEALRDHRRRQAEERLAAGAEWEDGDLIFCTEAGEPLKQDWTRSSFRRILKVAKLPTMRIYDLRHSCATLLLAGGTPLKVVSERLGHSTIALTGDTYSHVTPGMQKQAADMLQALATSSEC